jgi:choline dehydrogenase-like flavoprotein
MPVIASNALQSSYDTIIVGSGAAGGQVAYTLTMAGAKVLMLEAGRYFDPVRETAMFQLPSQAPLRAAATPDKQYGFYDSSLASGWTIPGEPYTNAHTDPSRQFRWWRQRMLGGRTNHWGRIALRNGPYDFKPYSRDGVGFDWPISYEDLAPYYDKVELLIGVFGTNEGLENSPDSSPGVLLPAPRLRAGELLAQKAGKKIGMPVIPIHRAVLSVRQDADNVPAKLHPNNPKAQRLLADSMRQRAACFWATDCHRGCSIKANYQAGTVHLPPALASGNLDILPHAMAREIVVDDHGRATGVIYIDKTTGVEHRASARSVVLAAGSQESVRLLLNSKSNRFPHGVGNSSGKLGRYLTDSVASSLRGQIPLLENLPIHNEDGAVGPHAYVPWWLYQEHKNLNFPGGYHLEFTSGRHMPTMTVANGFDWLTGRSGYAYGRQFKEDARRYYGSTQGFGAQGSMIPNEKSFCELDPTVKDQWGIPVLRFHWEWSDYELRQVEHQQKTIAALIEAMGGRLQHPPEKEGHKVVRTGGTVIHEVGGAIMGANPASSVTNAWSQTWDVKNLVVADGAVFAGTANKNPTLTIMALAWRAADHLLEELQKGNI